MDMLVLRRCALNIWVAAAMLAGCGGSQPPIGAPGAMPQTAAAVYAAPGKSWLLREAKNENLLYLSGFLAVGELAFRRIVRCREAPRPSCPLYRDRAMWAEQPWRCLRCGASIDPYLADTEQPIFKTYRRVVASLAHAVELKRLAAGARHVD